MANKNLGAAKAAKNDEFYTQYADIQREMNAYIMYNPDVFRGKTVLLPCDDPEWSNFTRFFAQNFEFYGLKKLISTSFAIESKNYKTDEWEPTLFEQTNPLYDADKTRVCGKIFVLDRDVNGDSRINIDDLEWRYLEGNGDFRSAEVTRLRDEADIIVTNPPFSLFREFFAWVIEGGKQFAMIANKNCVTYKEVFPYIKGNKIWTGFTPMGIDLLFEVPDEGLLIGGKKKGSGYRDIKGKIFARSQSVWFTNLDHGRRHEPLQLMTMADNKRYSRHKEIKGRDYFSYENYAAIDIPFTDAIPSDYDGIMGVPISFLDKYCPEQFEIIGIAEGDSGKALGLKPYPRELKRLNPSLRDGQLYYMADGMPVKPFARILIRKRNKR